MKKTVLSVMAHPDDAEFLVGGTLIRLQEEHGYEVHMATMTAGDCGSTEYGPEEISRIRRAENEQSARRIGGCYHCLEELDLQVTYCERTLEKVTRLIRLVRPTIVLTHSPSCYMLDHEMTSSITRAACFAAPIPNFLMNRQIGPRTDHIPHLYYADALEGKDLLGQRVKPAFHVDVSRVMELKAELLACHVSQREWLMRHHGVDHFVLEMKKWGEERGREIGVAYAEAFRQHLGHSYPQDNLLLKLLHETRP